MKILYATDLHGKKILFEKVLAKAAKEDIDALIIGGDLTPRGPSTIEASIAFQRDFLKGELSPMLARFRKETKKEIFTMMGNDDFRVNMPFLEEAESNETLKLLHKKVHRIGKHFIVGYSIINPTPFRLADWEKPENRYLPYPEKPVILTVEKEKGTIEDDLEELKELSDPENTIYVMHAPPFNTHLDMISAGLHVGSKSIRNFIEKYQPKLCLHGHIHESPKVSGSFFDEIGSSIIVNTGSPIALENDPKNINVAIIDLDDVRDIRVEGL